MNNETLQLILQKVEEMNIGEKEYKEFEYMIKRYCENKRIDDERRKKNREDTLKYYENELSSYNDTEYWKRTSSKEKKEYFSSVYGSSSTDQEYITERMSEHLKKAYKKFVEKISKV